MESWVVSSARQQNRKPQNLLPPHKHQFTRTNCLCKKSRHQLRGSSTPGEHEANCIKAWQENSWYSLTRAPPPSTVGMIERKLPNLYCTPACRKHVQCSDCLGSSLKDWFLPCLDSKMVSVWKHLRREINVHQSLQYQKVPLDGAPVLWLSILLQSLQYRKQTPEGACEQKLCNLLNQEFTRKPRENVFPEKALQVSGFSS